MGRLFLPYLELQLTYQSEVVNTGSCNRCVGASVTRSDKCSHGIVWPESLELVLRVNVLTIDDVRARNDDGGSEEGLAYLVDGSHNRVVAVYDGLGRVL